MWLAGFAMLILSVGYLLLVVVTGRIRTRREKDLAAAEKVDRTN